MEFYADPVDEWLLLPVGWFAIFFPQEAHAPEAVHGELHKATVKILTE
jgi:beta-galactosidase beta subunit